MFPSPTLIRSLFPPSIDPEKRPLSPSPTSGISSSTEQTPPRFSRVEPLARYGQTFSRKFGAIISLGVFIALGYILLAYPPVEPLAVPRNPYRLHKGTSTEAYVTIISDIENNPWTAIQARLLLFQTLYDPLTADTARDFVIIVIPDVSDDLVEELEGQGAVVVRKLPLVRSKETNTGLIVDEDLTKLRLFSLTQYEKVLYLDPSFVLVRSLSAIWSEPAASLRYGLGSNTINGRVHSNPPDGAGTIFNDDLWMARPSKELYGALLDAVDVGRVGGEHVSRLGFLNAYFTRSGTRPWGKSSRKWTAQWAHSNDILAGVAALQAAWWSDAAQREMDPSLLDFWRHKLGRMEGYWLAKRNVSKIAIPNIEVQLPETKLE